MDNLNKKNLIRDFKLSGYMDSDFIQYDVLKGFNQNKSFYLFI